MDDDEPGLEITLLLDRMSGGDESARDEVFGRLYGELRASAAAMLRGGGNGQTLQATALVHELWIRVSSMRGFAWKDRVHFLAVASKAMRALLVDRARRRGRQKRGGGLVREPLDAVVSAYEDSSLDLLQLHEALENLAGQDPRAARVVECRYFGGMTVDEVALAMGMPKRTVERDWEFARAWLHRALS